MRILALLAAVTTAVLATAVHAESEPADTYFGITGHYYMPDNDRSESGGAGGGLFVGFPLNLFYGGGSLEIGAFASTVSEDAPQPEYDVAGLELLLRGTLSQSDGFSSFLLFGGGAVRNKEFEEDASGFLTGGLGMLIPLPGGWSLRGEGRMYGQRADAPGMPEDLLFEYRAALGLEYSFAQAAYRPAPPPPPAAAAAPPAAKTAPPPPPPPPVDSDRDGVLDPADRCPATPPGTAVDLAGCPPVVMDGDEDGVPDDDDRCAGTPRGVAVDDSGCQGVVDADSDGIVDARDRCPNTPPGASVNFEGCPAPIVDSDGDGVADASDRCAGTAKGAKVDARGCPASNDNDQDGVSNATDKCPGTPAGMRVDGNGCVVRQSVSFSNITFEFNSSQLTATAGEVLNGIAEGLKNQPALSVTIVGHTDAVGSPAQNLALSRSRAQAVAAYLIGKGVKPARLTTEGVGETRPMADNGSDSGRAQNRRVEFKIRR